MNHEDTWSYQQTKQRKGWRWQEFYLSWWFQPLWTNIKCSSSRSSSQNKMNTPPPPKKKKNMKLQSISTGLPFEHPLLVSLHHLSKPIRPDIIHLSGALLWALRLLCHALQGFTLLNFFLSGVNGQCFPCFCWLKIMFEWPVYTCIYVQICI